MGLTFDQDNHRHCVQINISENDVVEGPEQFSVNLNSADNEILVPDTAIIEIEERGGKTWEEVPITILITFIIVPMVNGTWSSHSLNHKIWVYVSSYNNGSPGKKKKKAYISPQTHIGNLLLP